MRAWLSTILMLALFVGSLGMGVARARNVEAGATETTVVDSLLGPLLICHRAGNANDHAPGHGSPCGDCALCTALASLALAGLVFLTCLMRPAALVGQDRRGAYIGSTTAGWPPGGLGSRAPPPVAG